MHQGENIWVTEKSLIAKNETKLYSRANKILNLSGVGEFPLTRYIREEA